MTPDHIDALEDNVREATDTIGQLLRQLSERHSLSILAAAMATATGEMLGGSVACAEMSGEYAGVDLLETYLSGIDAVTREAATISHDNVLETALTITRREVSC